MKIKCLIPLPVAALAALFCAPASGSAQSILLSAGNFTLLGGTAITNTGSTNIISGNVGLSPTADSAITGFPPGVITGGGAIIATGAVTGQAMTDLMRAAAGLAGMTADANQSGLDLGGLTLLPGVYKFDATAVLNGALRLDANFQDQAFWVFQIGTTLTTSENSSVTLINPGSHGGRDDGIFWDVGAAINIGAYNELLGNYLAGTTITFGDTTIAAGRVLAQAAIGLDTNSINSQAGPNGGDWTGGLTYDSGGTRVVPAPVPEPATFLWLAPLGALAFVLWRRRRMAA